MPTRTFNESSLKAGDHAYVAPPYSQRGGSPYLIVRIVDLPPTPQGGIPKARVAYYLRRRDVTNRSLADHRVIFATFMDGLVPLSHIRQKVQVMYRDYLEDPETFKRQPDCFVFTQIYDRFMHKPFDLVPTSQVMNAPDHILNHLRSHYEFVCTELATVTQLCDAMRGCVACHGFAAKDDSVTCAVCSKTWHLGCLEPPLLKKPALGWRWSCIKCTMEEEESSSESDGGVITPTSDRNATRAARRKAKQPLLVQKNGKSGKGKAPAIRPQLDVAKWKSLNGWPYRYFGEHVHHESVLDLHDPIWPRASTSVGARFQCLDIPGEEPDLTIRRPPQPKKRKNRKKADEVEEEPERGSSTSCELLWRPEACSSEVPLHQMLESVRWAKTANRFGNVDLIMQTLQIINAAASTSSTSSATASTVEQAVNKTLAEPLQCASLARWTENEEYTFDEELQDYEDELGRYVKTRKIKTMPEIVHHYYREKGWLKRFMHLEDPAKDKFAAAGPQGIDAELDGKATAGDDGESSAAEDIPTSSSSGSRRGLHQCAMCGIDKAETWYRCPEGLGEITPSEKKDRVICPSCSIQWRHYGSIHPALTEAELDNRAAKDGKARKKISSGQRSPSPHEKKPLPARINSKTIKQEDGTVVPAPFKSCVLCKRPEPKSTNFECLRCGVACHTGCYGIPPDADPDNWHCDGCAAIIAAPEGTDVEASCALCPKLERAPEAPLSARDAFKRADDERLVHLICALWHHEVLFNNAEILDTALQVRDVHRVKTQETCSICHREREGACVRCDACSKHFHVSCAWAAGYRFSFEVMPVKETWRERLPRARFKEETGDMRAIITCKSHPWTYTRLLYDLGQKDRNTDLTALMTFALFMKDRDVHAKYPLLDRVRMLDFAGEAGMPMEGSTTQQDEPHSLNDIYMTKDAYIKPVKQKRKKRGDAKAIKLEEPLIVEEPPSMQPSETVVLPEPAVNGQNGVVKKRKRKTSATSYADEALSSLSEDEVMPTASTSRARGATRATRGVTLKDLLADDEGPRQRIGQQKNAPQPDRVWGVPKDLPIDDQVSTMPAYYERHPHQALLRNGGAPMPNAYHMPKTGTSHPRAQSPPIWHTLQLPHLARAYFNRLERNQQQQVLLKEQSGSSSRSVSSASTVPVQFSASPEVKVHVMNGSTAHTSRPEHASQ